MRTSSIALQFVCSVGRRCCTCASTAQQSLQDTTFQAVQVICRYTTRERQYKLAPPSSTMCATARQALLSKPCDGSTNSSMKAEMQYKKPERSIIDGLHSNAGDLSTIVVDELHGHRRRDTYLHLCTSS
jgi:hypothetical protein